MMKQLASAAFVATVSATSAFGFPLDGTYFSACAGEGVAEDGALEARLTFPELCFDGACCELSNPTRLRGLPDHEGALPEGLDGNVTVEPPRDAAHGDMATNAAMVLAKPAGLKPRDIAEALAPRLAADPRIASAEVAGPGF
jgi:hypothetical protein